MDQKISVSNPQNAALTSNNDHSEGFNHNSLPSLTTRAIIASTRRWTAKSPARHSKHRGQRL
ncbi:MAG TPA: hypothetical protein VNU65_07250 [Xanthobacteraceae bacterium]|jgi:hypothetical protein|nr:hypothetical protein [Xanthobacteraceae bacterium]